MLCLISSQKKNWKAIFTLMAVFSNGFTHKASTSSGTFAEKRPASKSSGPETPTSSLARLPLPSSSHHSPPRGPSSSDSRPSQPWPSCSVGHGMLLVQYLLITVNIYCLLHARHRSQSFMIIKTHWILLSTWWGQINYIRGVQWDGLRSHRQ